ncbi:MAG: cytochrome b/b6 domain-containing protein [Roseiarcus sp.]
MPLRNSQQDYGSIARFAHWMTALFVLLAWLLGQFRDIFPPGAARGASVSVHMALGLGVILLIVLRLAGRALDPPPPAIAANRFEPWLSYAASAGHLLLYALLIAAPILGIVMQFARGEALPVFGLFDIPSPWTMDRAFFREMLGLHQLAANVLGVVAAGHAAAALFHHWALGDRTLARMLPGLAR